MKHPLKSIPILLAAGLLSGAPALAGSFSTTFNDSTGMTLAGAALIATNRAIVCPNAAGAGGSVTLDDLDAGQAIESLTATFQLQLGPGSGNPADGLSFNFGPFVVAGDMYGEEGPAQGNQALTIEFDTYDNGGGEAPALDIKFDGTEIAHHPFNKSDMVTSQLENVSIQCDRSGSVTVSYKGQTIYDHVLVPGWTPTAGLFNFSARSGGESEDHILANLSIQTVLQGAAVAPTVTRDPQSATVNEGSGTNFTFGVSGSAPFTFQWTKNAVDILDETNATLTLNPVHYTDNGAQIRVRVSNTANTTTSGAATLTVIRDTTPPTVLRAAADLTGTQVTVTYSEPVSDTALTVGNYSIDQGINVLSITRVDASRVTLTTSQMPGGHAFTLTINGVQDTATSPPNTIAANTHVNFSSFLFQVGAVIHKKYANIGDGAGSFNALQSDPRYPNFPDRQDIMQSFEYPANGLFRDIVADPRDNPPPLDQQFSDTLETYFIPAQTGDYVFYATGADLNDVYLSTDSDPVNMVNIAQTSGWTNPRDWNVLQCGTTNGLRSDYYLNNLWPGAGDPTTGSALIHLDAGTRYYMFAVHHRYTWSGADDFAVTFSLSGQPLPAPGDAPLLTGNLLGFYLDPTGASVNFSQQPADVTVLQGRLATFTALATGHSAYGTTVSYQWQTAPSGSGTFTNIPGAVGTSYSTAANGLADNGRKYQVLATVPGLTVNSRVATLTVNADTIPPHLVTAAALPSQSGVTTDVGVTFDEPLDRASAETIANYHLSSGTITAAKYYATSPGVVLTVSGFAAGASVTVANVADPYGNHMPSANLPVALSSMHWGVVGADELGLGNAVLAVAPNAFDVYSDGVGEWAAYDETTFVYEQVTGDFDKQVRVEYQDPSSQWARAGLIARDVTDFGVNRATQTGSGSATPPFDGTAGRYQKIHVNPVVTAMGTPGNDSWEGNRRLDTGGPTDAAFQGSPPPQYPMAWCRLKRSGQTFTLMRSDDGVNWVVLGTTTWGVNDQTHTPMPDTLYVGPEFSPENLNVASALRSVFGAKFRDYGTHTPALSFQATPGGMTITFEGTLQWATSLSGGQWTDLNVTSPYPVPITGTLKFYRAKQ